ncbi:MAG: Uncharacterized protein YegL, partial [uncultured Gemmatimonadetes bacterium]
VDAVAAGRCGGVRGEPGAALPVRPPAGHLRLDGRRAAGRHAGRAGNLS